MLHRSAFAPIALRQEFFTGLNHHTAPASIVVPDGTDSRFESTTSHPFMSSHQHHSPSTSNVTAMKTKSINATHHASLHYNNNGKRAYEEIQRDTTAREMLCQCEELQHVSLKEEERKLKRRAINRESARRLRQKRRDLIEGLQQQCTLLAEQNAHLMAHSAKFEQQHRLMVAQMAVLRQRFVNKAVENKVLIGKLRGLEKELKERRDVMAVV